MPLPDLLPIMPVWLVFSTVSSKVTASTTVQKFLSGSALVKVVWTPALLCTDLQLYRASTSGHSMYDMITYLLFISNRKKSKDNLLAKSAPHHNANSIAITTVTES